MDWDKRQKLVVNLERKDINNKCINMDYLKMHNGQNKIRKCKENFTKLEKHVNKGFENDDFKYNLILNNKLVVKLQRMALGTTEKRITDCNTRLESCSDLTNTVNFTMVEDNSLKDMQNRNTESLDCSKSKELNMSRIFENSLKHANGVLKITNNNSHDLFDNTTVIHSNHASYSSKSELLEDTIQEIDGIVSTSNSLKRNTGGVMHKYMSRIQTSTPLQQSNNTHISFKPKRLRLQIGTSSEDLNSSTISPIVNRLRKVQKKNYNESSLTETSTEVKLAGPKVPVYKKIIELQRKEGKSGDLYDFDEPDFYKDHLKNKQKRKSSEKFNKTIHGILEKLEQKENANKLKKSRCRKNALQNTTYDKKIETVLTQVMNKINKRKDKTLHNKENQALIDPNNGVGKNGVYHKKNGVLIEVNKNDNNKIESNIYRTEHIKNTDVEKNNEITMDTENAHSNGQIEVNATKNVYDCDITTNRSNINDYTSNLSTINNTYQNTRITATLHLNPPDFSNIKSKEVVDASIYKTITVPHSSQKSISISSSSNEFYGFDNKFSDIQSIAVLSKSIESDAFCGFTTAEQIAAQRISAKSNAVVSRCQSKSKGIKIISNISIHPPINHTKKVSRHDFYGHWIDLSEKYSLQNNFGFNEEDSTEPSSLNKKKRMVWRFSSTIKRNPHYLLIKSNALPCLNQDMVIDYSLAQSIEQSTLRTKEPGSHVIAPKITCQTKILDYVECSTRLRHEEERETFSLSLYDYEEFHIPATSRKVLGLLQKEQVISTPKKHVHTIVPLPDISDIENDKENSFTSNTGDLDVTASENIIHQRPSTKGLRRYSKKSKEKYKVADADEANTVIDYDRDNHVLDSSHGKECTKAEDDIQLFDEDEPELLENTSIVIPKIQYQRKKRKRLPSEASDVDVDEKPRRKKKDMMTKEEAAAFEKWASEFNAMCEEVDKHELVVE